MLAHVWSPWTSAPFAPAAAPCLEVQHRTDLAQQLIVLSERPGPQEPELLGIGQQEQDIVAHRLLDQVPGNLTHRGHCGGIVSGARARWDRVIVGGEEDGSGAVRSRNAGEDVLRPSPDESAPQRAQHGLGPHLWRERERAESERDLVLVESPLPRPPALVPTTNTPSETPAAPQPLVALTRRTGFDDGFGAQLQRVIAGNQAVAASEDSSDDFETRKFSTVGAVALDQAGNITAGTSTGGMTNKRYGRIGDSPIIGAGTYADNQACGISATGHGEYFIRAAVAHDICARVKYQGVDLGTAATAVINEKLVQMGGAGGIIGIDPQGNVVYAFNTTGMYRASIDKSGQLDVRIFR